MWRAFSQNDLNFTTNYSDNRWASEWFVIGMNDQNIEIGIEFHTTYKQVPPNHCSVRGLNVFGSSIDGQASPAHMR